jgi:hypothetical protein
MKWGLHMRSKATVLAEVIAPKTMGTLDLHRPGTHGALRSTCQTLHL